MQLTYVKTDNKDVNTAYYIAVSDMIGNIKPFQGELWEKEKPVIIAGMGYDTPWTRDAAINVMNAGGLLFPEVSENTLLSVLKRDSGKLIIDGQYWDKIIWVLGAWHLYQVTVNTDFLLTAYQAAENTLTYMEDTEFDETLNLFRGAACYGDGIAAYPDRYIAPSKSSGIMSFIEECPEHLVKTGMGLPMYALSTNCLYYQAYITADLMAEELGIKKEYGIQQEHGIKKEYGIKKEHSIKNEYRQKAERMKEAINTHFWNPERGLYDYLVDDRGGCDSSEGLGQAFAILFGVADKDKAESIFANQPVTPYGIACVYPSFGRYRQMGNYHFGRHSGTVWPHIQAFWADAAARYGRIDIFLKEFRMLTDVSVRDGLFAEIYHPETGEIYGGLQEGGEDGIILWKSQLKQTWSATGYLRLLFHVIAGIRFEKEGISFEPCLPDGIGQIEITNLHIRNTVFTIKISGRGSKIKHFVVDLKETDEKFVPYESGRTKEIAIVME